MELTQAEHERLLVNLSAELNERNRLSALSDLALIRETLSDEPDPPAMPDRPRSVCLSVPIDVAHDVVAFSECHCEESVAKGEEETNTEAYKPCLYCACQAALFRATGHEMYRPEPPETK